jgi:hypothetical protein
MTALRRRWLRFTLRTMLIGVTVLGCLLAYPLNWIRQRREARQRGDIIFELVEYRKLPTPGGDPPTPAPWPLRLFGEPGYETFIASSDTSNAGFKRIAALYPESKAMQSHIPIVPLP